MESDGWVRNGQTQFELRRIEDERPVDSAQKDEKVEASPAVLTLR